MHMHTHTQRHLCTYTHAKRQRSKTTEIRRIMHQSTGSSELNSELSSIDKVTPRLQNITQYTVSQLLVVQLQINYKATQYCEIIGYTIDWGSHTTPIRLQPYRCLVELAIINISLFSWDMLYTIVILP